ncbi:MAG TPA: polyphosphate kinase 1, partial [Candidatus Binatia bacterium]|nr:polyphosphate kinase 1 [Candidatus Binatia bacterium]
MASEILKGLWLDRDLGWLEFNHRVLAEAQDERNPLLERLKFLAIFTSNLDEFFMKRIAVLEVENHGSHSETLAELRQVIIDMVRQQQACYAGLLPHLAGHGIRILSWNELSERQRLEAKHFFQRNVLPALTPLVVDSAHPTPFLSNLSLSWGCRLREPGSNTRLYGRVKVPTGLSAWIRLRQDTPAGSRWFLSLAELVRQHLDDVFPGLETYDHTLFRITRDAEVEWHGEAGESLHEIVAERIRLR